MIKIACWDPIGQYKPGELIEGMNTTNVADKRGVALLPYDTEIPRTALTPFVISQWGQGWVFDRSHGEKGCPMIIEVLPERPNFSWAVRVVKNDEKKLSFSGQIRLIPNPHPRGMGGGLKQEVYCSQLPDLDEHGGITIYGRSTMNSNVGGLLFTDFYCVGDNMKIEWSAVCQHKQKQQ